MTHVSMLQTAKETLCNGETAPWTKCIVKVKVKLGYIIVRSKAQLKA